jgi:phosphoribosylformylglycinamidine synthase
VLAPVDLGHEATLARTLVDAVSRSLVTSACDVSRGGLVSALAHACAGGDVGAFVTVPAGPGTTQRLFSESPGRVVVTTSGRHLDALVALFTDAGLAVVEVGEVGGDALVLEGLDGAGEDGTIELALDDLVDALERGLPAVMSGAGA